MQFGMKQNTGEGTTSGESNEERFPPIPADIYEAEVVKAEIKDSERERFEWKKSDWELNVQFRLVGGEYENRRFFINPPLFEEMTPKQVSAVYLAAMLGVEVLPATFTIDEQSIAALNGRRVQIRVAKNWVDKDGGKYVNRVEDVRPIGGTTPNGGAITQESIAAAVANQAPTPEFDEPF